MPQTIRLRVTVERHHPKLPRFVVVPALAIAAWNLTGTTIIEASLREVELGRRSLKRWDEERWWIDLSEPLCRKAGVDTGDRAVLALRLASTRMPAELSRLLKADPAAKAAWERLTEAQQRQLREHVADGKQPATRARRAAKALGGR